MTNVVSTTRRRFLMSGTGALLSLEPIDARAVDDVCSLPAIKTSDLRAEVAVSLREALKNAKAGGGNRLKNLTRIDGVIEDDDDVIVWGLSEKDQPDLYLDDLVVAIRSSLNLYGNIQPGISLDPIKESEPLLDRNALNDAGRRRFIDACSRQAQSVRVDGLPRHCRVTNVLVDADYRMKQVSQGTLQLPLTPPLKGTFVRRLERRRELIRSGALPEAESSSRRFWFEPGKFEYTHDRGIAFLQSAQVILKDADDDTSTGSNVGTADFAAKEFSCAWTARMEETYRAEPIWRDMHNIYRHFAVAQMIKDRSLLPRKSAIIALIDEHKLEHVALPDTLPGLGRWERLERKESGRRYEFVSTVCGGVSVGVAGRIAANAIVRSGQNLFQLENVRNTITRLRPGRLSLSWPITEAAIQATEIMRIELLKRREEERRQSIEASNAAEQKRSYDMQRGLAFLGALVGLGLAVGWLVNRRAGMDQQSSNGNAEELVVNSGISGSRTATVVPETVLPIATNLARGISRNQPCPCNSGKRFKHCHGAHQSIEQS